MRWSQLLVNLTVSQLLVNILVNILCLRLISVVGGGLSCWYGIYLTVWSITLHPGEYSVVVCEMVSVVG